MATYFDTSNDTDKDLVGEEIGKATLRSLEYNEKTPHHEQYVLPNGIKIGSTRKEVLETFGDPTEFSGGENDFIDKLNYYTKVENEEMYTGASFAFFNNEENKDNDVVTAISIYYETYIPSFKIRY